MTPDASRLLELLWTRYAAEVPYARTFAQLSGGRFQNDHIALRSLARPGGGIALLAGVFARFGWKPAGTYAFAETHLSAIHMSHPEGLPRVFISELHAHELSPEAQHILSALPADPPAPTSIDALADWFSAPPPPEESALLALERESQYGAWLLAFGRKVNHFTGTVDDVEAWQKRMLEAGVPMKKDIEGAPGGTLRQTATHAAPVSITLRDGRTRSWPYAYFEIAQRAPGFDGFLDSQAKALFDMTKR